MLTRNFCRVLLLVLLLPSATLALGLGEIHLKSSLNSPLDADIDVVGANADELSGLKANLASRDTFGRNRLEYPAFMAGVTLEPRTTADGRTVLHMHSADAVNEPIATLLVEVNWARGHLVREYTVLLDPPVFSGDAASSTSVDGARDGCCSAQRQRRTARAERCRERCGRSRTRRPHHRSGTPRRVCHEPVRGERIHVCQRARRGRRQLHGAQRRYAVLDHGPGLWCRGSGGTSARTRGRLSRQSGGLRRQYEYVARRQPLGLAGRCRAVGDQSWRGGDGSASPVLGVE